jgi:LuxR family transcriptional regulator, maltose regulon positive regulatory protein
MTTGRLGEAAEDRVEAGREALARGAWEQARELFQVAVDRQETPEALEGLSWAAWWLNDADAVFATRELAFRRYREAGDPRGAARMALWLASDHLDFRGEAALANGWRERARRLLSTLDEAPEHGWLAVLDGSLALEADNDPAAGEKLGAEAAAIGVRLGMVDLQMLGLAVQGLALVTEGHIREGMRRLDEAVAAAVSGDLQDVVSIMFVSCYLIYACERIRDFDREAQWCRKVEEVAARLGIRQLLGECRTHYGGVLMWRGAWREAEEQLARAARDFAASRPLAVADGVARLAELRRRQGRLSEAAGLLEEAPGNPLAVLGRAHLALDLDDPQQAAHLAERSLRSLTAADRTGRAAWLEVAACAQARLGDHTRAAEAATALRSVAELIGTDPLLASASFAGGVVAAASGDHQAAQRHLEDAIDTFQRCGAPFETARSRIGLAETLRAVGRAGAAIAEVRRARDVFDALGAALAADRAACLLGELGALADRTRTARSPSTTPGLTARQAEVLRLVAEGLSDKEIARRLALSRHTVHRHISNILTRLGVPSRAAAVARANEFLCRSPWPVPAMAWAPEVGQ